MKFKGQLNIRKMIFRCGCCFGMMLIVLRCCTSPDVVYADFNDSVHAPETISHQGLVVESLEDIREPEEILVQDGERYELVSSELKEVDVEGTLTYVSADIAYELEGQQQPPETTMVTLYDERTGKEYEHQLFFMETQEKESFWRDTFTFPITVTGIDAEVLFLGDLEIPGNEELINYKSEFLEALNLSESDYRIHSIEWENDAYERDGIFYRNAVAKGEKRIRIVDATYGGQIRMPDTKGYQYVSLYKPIEDKERVGSEEENVSESEADLLIQPQQTADENFLNQLKTFLQEHVVIITVGVFLIVAILGCTGLLIFAGKKKSTD